MKKELELKNKKIEYAVIFNPTTKAKQVNDMNNLINYCNKQNLTIIKTFHFKSSSRITQKYRNEMFHFIKRQNYRLHIVCDNFTDIISNHASLLTLESLIKNNKITIHFCNQNLIFDKNNYNPATASFFSSFIASVLTYIANLSYNIKRAQEYNIMNGLYQGLAPIGYKNIRDTSERADIVVDQEKASIIMKLYRAYSTEEYSIKELTEFAHSLGLKNKKDHLVSKSCIHDILTNPFYYGEMSWKKKLYPHKYPRIIHKSTFDRVQDILKQRTPHKKP